MLFLLGYCWYLCLVLAHLSGAAWGLAPAGKWDTFNIAPRTKTVYPAAIHSTSGVVTGAELLVGKKGAAALASGSWVTLDFGVEVGGLITLTIDAPSPAAALALSFTESPAFIRPNASDDSSFPAQNTTFDGVLRVDAPLASGRWTQPTYSLRGGFRYLTLVASGGEVTLADVSCAINFMPHVTDLRAYEGYFYALDEGAQDVDLLTKVWYAGAYTVQTNTVPLDTGREVPFAPPGSWANNATLGVAGPIIVDGAKRDRAVWPGDMGIAVPTQFVSTNDLLPTKNALSTMFAAINPKTGALPESGPPLSQQGSDTYHAWTLIGTYNYHLFSADTDWLLDVWANYTKAVAFLEGKVDSSGLMNVTGLRDWARQGGGGHNAEGNAILYRVLVTASELATYANDTALSLAWAQNATALKQVFNDVFWLADVEMYRDNATTTLCPEDANSFAVVFNLTQSEAQKAQISDGLVGNWNDIGPVVPELPDTISPFIAGYEVQAHFEAGNDARALELIRRTWGYMLTTNLSVQSTLLEGFTANGSLAYRYYQGYNDDPSYTSHSHGWSSGPTSALTFYALGLTVTAPAGQAWVVAPHIQGGLPGAQGGFSTPLGWFGVQWALAGTGGLRVEINTPTGTDGILRLPAGAVRGTEYVLDGRAGRFEAGAGVEIALEGGIHVVMFSGET
ncbi:glycoside hydrolase family 78 protein [Hypholoma sublateritium FD-334 SS-4]|uniref:Glycoside hydrolase family 78 protein n=1 Tax=Hypholoma sublateritium (strain FD-334 SS-4) TaxID=945553 RepID=A0A0D2LFU5_HYPSF|nr:glycoside hydrolase family 78 protein [Hypholoma sublateritium FD-334 SS-4]